MSQVNLLPPELRARQKVKQLTTLIIGAGAAIIVLLLAFWFLQSQKLAGINDDIAAQNLTNSGLQTQIDQLQEFQQLQEEAAAQEQLLTTAWVGEVSFSQMLMDLSRTIPSDAYLDSFNAALTVPVAGAATPTDDLRGLLHGRRCGRRLREPRELADAARIRQGMGQPVVLHGDRDGAEQWAVFVPERRRSVGGRADGSRSGG